MNLNPIQYRVPPLIFDEDVFMKLKIQHGEKFINDHILQMMHRDKNLIPSLMQNAKIEQEDRRYDRSVIYHVDFFIVPAQQVIEERRMLEQPIRSDKTPRNWR